MPPRVRLSDAEAARLPGLLAQPVDGASFGRCRTHAERVLWVLDVYGQADAVPLTPGLVTMLVFEQGTNLALTTVAGAIAEATAAGWVEEGADGGVALSAAGRARASELFAASG